ncbi:MAG: hypothetical protein LC722_04325, partial [Actinobacteria bacterium]|nr:hypothetical protein [Actinomycetota bacterium]
MTLDTNTVTSCDAVPPTPTASITIVKDADPDTPQDFQFTGDLGNFVLDDDPVSGTPRQLTFTVDPGSHTVVEPALGPGAESYDLESIVCSGGATAVNLTQRRVLIDVEDGDEVTCVFLNQLTGPPPPPPPGDATITIVKEADPDTPQDFQFTGDLGPFVLDDDPLSATPRQLTFTVDPGSYTVTEPALGPGAEPYDLESITCTGGVTAVHLTMRGVEIDVAAGDQVTCVFVNTREGPPPPPPPGQASITIVKETEPDSAQNFEFTGDLGKFVLDDDLLSATPRQLTFNVDPGTYTVAESQLAGWDLDSITCTGGSVVVNLAKRQVVITVDPGQTLTCVFVNQAEVIPP